MNRELIVSFILNISSLTFFYLNIFMYTWGVLTASTTRYDSSRIALCVSSPNLNYLNQTLAKPNLSGLNIRFLTKRSWSICIGDAY